MLLPATNLPHPRRPLLLAFERSRPIVFLSSLRSACACIVHTEYKYHIYTFTYPIFNIPVRRDKPERNLDTFFV